jgi:NIMA (never in mitosis gene a)-related kinase 1/4/5
VSKIVKNKGLSYT